MKDFPSTLSPREQLLHERCALSLRDVGHEDRHGPILPTNRTVRPGLLRSSHGFDIVLDGYVLDLVRAVCLQLQHEVIVVPPDHSTSTDDFRRFRDVFTRTGI
jgi:hypothetical protein